MPATRPTLVTVPCFSGAPWDERQLAPLRAYPVRTMRLPEAADQVDRSATSSPRKSRTFPTSGHEEGPGGGRRGLEATLGFMATPAIPFA